MTRQDVAGAARDPVPVFPYDSGTDQPFTAGSQAPPNEIIALAGGRNIPVVPVVPWSSCGMSPVSPLSAPRSCATTGSALLRYLTGRWNVDRWRTWQLEI
ncbi:hypothetical protein GCM10009634_60530 [Saccharothrix xinjiangensis]